MKTAKMAGNAGILGEIQKNEETAGTVLREKKGN